MSATMSTSVEAADEQHDVAVELTDAVDSCWFANEFAAGERIALQLGSETNVAEVIGVEPADGAIAVDLSAFDRDDLGGSVALPDMSSTGMQTTNLGVMWSVESVPVDSDAARDDTTDRVICDCGTLCQAGRGHSVHQSQGAEDSTDEQSDDELPHPSEDPTISYCHEGKQYDLAVGEQRFEVVEFDESGPAGGIVVVDFVNSDETPMHEHERSGAGVSRAAIESYVEQYGDQGGVITANCLLSDLRELKIGEVDAWSYEDLYYEQTTA